MTAWGEATRLRRAAVVRPAGRVRAVRRRRSGERRTEDFGGCRCQAHALTGDAARTDPACSLSPDHATLVALTRPGTPAGLVPRRPAARIEQHS